MLVPRMHGLVWRLELDMHRWDLGGRLGFLPENKDDGQDIALLRRKQHETPSLSSGFRMDDHRLPPKGKEEYYRLRC